MLKFRNILVCLGLLACALAHASPSVVLRPGQKQVDVARSMDILVAPGGRWRFQQVRGEFAGRFRANHAEEPNFGFTDSVIWLRFTLDSDAVPDGTWYFVERYPVLDHVSLFAPLPGGGYKRTNMGDTYPFSHRLIDHRAFIFPLNTRLKGPRTYYVRISGKGALNISPVLYSAAGLVEYTYRNTLLYGIFYGCLLIMVLYNALLALSLREPVYFYFVVFLIGILEFNLNVNGFGLQYLWPDLPKLDEYYWLGIYICIPALAMYSRHFLALGPRFPRYDRLLRRYLVALAVLFVIQLLIPPPWSYELSTLVVAISVLLFSWLGWKVWSRGFRAARLYVMTWFVFWVLIFLYVLGNVDWMPYGAVVTMLPHISALWVVVMLSLALGDRIRFLEQEHNQLSAAARESLERHVAEIGRMNRDKSTFLQYMSHELNTPINWIGAADSLESGGATGRDEIRDLARKGRRRLIGMVGTSLRYFDLADRTATPLVSCCAPAVLIGELLGERAHSLATRHLTVDNLLTGELMVRANQDELREVLAMALDNAIRFSEEGGCIQINGGRMDGEVALWVRDDGCGASTGQLESLFEPFFVVGSRHHEEGYGLSLAMARVMIEQVGGRIWAESDGPGRGFTLVIRLPQG